MTRKSIKFLNSFSVAVSAMFVRNINFADNDWWKIYLSMLVTAIVIRNYIKD